MTSNGDEPNGETAPAAIAASRRDGRKRSVPLIGMDDERVSGAELFETFKYARSLSLSATDRAAIDRLETAAKAASASVNAGPVAHSQYPDIRRAELERLTEMLQSIRRKVDAITLGHRLGRPVGHRLDGSIPMPGTKSGIGTE